MKTPNLIHVQKCSVPGCMDTALITIAYGKHATAPKGFCNKHSEADLNARATEKAAEDKLLKELGFESGTS